MATRVTHPNGSDGHDGTFVYRSTSPMDPQALPAPIADEPPVALGAVFEYIDNVSEDGTYYYRTQDHEGGQVSTVSDEVSVVIPPDYDSAQIGDEIGGGIYAGTITYADDRQFHIVAAKQSGEIYGLQWKTSNTSTSGTDDFDDGMANTQAMEVAGIADHPAGEHCVNYSSSGFEDWYLPAKNEMILIMNNLVDSGHPEFSDNSQSIWRWFSREYDATYAGLARWDTLVAFDQGSVKDAETRNTRPIRRVPV